MIACRIPRGENSSVITLGARFGTSCFIHALSSPPYPSARLHTPRSFSSNKPETQTCTTHLVMMMYMMMMVMPLPVDLSVKQILAIAKVNERRLPSIALVPWQLLSAGGIYIPFTLGIPFPAAVAVTRRHRPMIRRLRPIKGTPLATGKPLIKRAPLTAGKPLIQRAPLTTRKRFLKGTPAECGPSKDRRSEECALLSKLVL